MNNEPTLIWSGEHQAWWRAPANGYTSDIFAAGVYTHDEAHSLTHHCGPEKRIALQSAEKMLREHIFGLSHAHPDSVIHKLVAIVPREPTSDMVGEALTEARRHSRDATFPATGVRHIWRTMIAQHDTLFQKAGE